MSVLEAGKDDVVRLHFYVRVATALLDACRNRRFTPETNELWVQACIENSKLERAALKPIDGRRWHNTHALPP